MITTCDTFPLACFNSFKNSSKTLLKHVLSLSLLCQICFVIATSNITNFALAVGHADYILLHICNITHIILANTSIHCALVSSAGTKLMVKGIFNHIDNNLHKILGVRCKVIISIARQCF